MHDRVSDEGLYELAATLISASANLNKFLSKRKLPSLSSSHPAPNLPLIPENAPFEDARGTIIEAAEQIIQLVRGPRGVLIDLSFQHCASASLQVIQHYKIPHHIPLQGATTYSKIADSVGSGVTPALVERVVGHAISFGLFAQSPCGHVAHNAASALLVTDPDLEAWIYLNTNVAYPAGANVAKTIDQYGVSSEASEAAYGVSIGRKISQFSRFREPDGADLHQVFAKAMRGISSGGAYDVSHAVSGGYPWDTLYPALVVDVGGGPGHVAMALARRYPSEKLRFEVQDLPETVEVGARNCPDDLQHRIAFRAHDFFTSQPKHDVSEQEAIVYFARFILHDWSDKYAQQILQPLAEGLRPQDRIILNEVAIPAPGEMPREIERRLHDRDLLMLMNLNGRERTLGAFTAIFESVTPQLKISRVVRPPQGELSLIEVVLKSNEIVSNGVVPGASAVNGHG